MKRHQILAVPLILAAFAAPISMSSAVAETSTTTPAETLRPAIQKALVGAQTLMTEKKYTEALALFPEVDAIADKSLYEQFFVESVRVKIAAGLNDNAQVAKSMEVLLASGRLPATTLPPLILQLGNLYLTMGNYPKAIGLLTRSLKDYGEDRTVRIKLIQAIYLSKDYARAATELRTLITADEMIAKTPEIDTLKLWGSAVTLLNDKVAYIDVLEKFVTYYPTKEYWADLLNRLAARPGFPERLLIEVYRLQFATGSMGGAVDYTELAQLASSAGFPAEAKKVIDAGYAAGVLGTGTAKEVAAQQKLRDTTNKSAADDLRTLAQGEANADKPGKDGTGLTNLGYILVQVGQADKGLALMERGIAKGLGKRSEDGKLHLGMAQAQAGHKEAALKTLATVGGTDGTADLARYWIMYVNRK